MFYAIAVVLVLIADQALKYWVSLNIDLNTGEQALIPGFIKLVNIHNSGAAFGLLGGGGWRWVFVVVALVFAVVVVYALKRNLIHGKLGRWAAVGVLAGSIGNCIDRVAYGYVVDMFKFEFLGDSRLNAIFNVADVFISCCGVLFCLYIIFGGENSLATAGEEDGEPAPKRRSGSHSAGSHSKKPQARRPAAKEAPRAQRPSAEPRTRIPVKEYTPPALRRAARAARGAPGGGLQEPLCRVGERPPARPAEARGRASPRRGAPERARAQAGPSRPGAEAVPAEARAEAQGRGDGVLA